MRKIFFLISLLVFSCSAFAQIHTGGGSSGSGGSGTTTNPLTMNNSNSGAASGSTFNGSAGVTVSANTLGAASLLNANTFTGGGAQLYSATTAVSQLLSLKNTTAATVSTPQNSPNFALCGREWVGAGADGEGCLNLQFTPTAGLNAGGTFAFTHTGTGTGAYGTTFPGSISAGSSPNAGYFALPGNTANFSVISNSAGFMGPTSASFTAYALQLPSTAPSGTQVLQCGTPTSGVSACSFATSSSGGGLAAIAKTASYTSVAGDFTTPSSITFTCTAACVYTLPSTAPTSGGYVVVQNAVGASGGFPLTVFPNGLTFNGKTNASFIIPPNGQALIASDGSNYQGGGSSKSMPRPQDRRWAYWESTGQGTFPTSGQFGVGFTVNDVGSSHSGIVATTSEPTYIDFVSGAVSGNTGGYNSGGNATFATGTNLLYESRVQLPATTTIRTWVGMVSAGNSGTLAASDTPATNYVAFRYSTGAADTNWMACVGNGTTACTSTGVAVSTSGVKLAFQMLDNLATPAIAFYVNGILTNVITASLPAAFAGEPLTEATTLTSSATHVRTAYAYVEADN